jgi:hypothetical protein
MGLRFPLMTFSLEREEEEGRKDGQGGEGMEKKGIKGGREKADEE